MMINAYKREPRVSRDGDRVSGFCSELLEIIYKISNRMSTSIVLDGI